MDRFSETSPLTYAVHHGACISPDYPTCDNCGRAVERVTLVPEFEYMGCDDCRAEAEAVIEREARELAVVASEPGESGGKGREARRLPDLPPAVSVIGNGLYVRRPMTLIERCQMAQARCPHAQRDPRGTCYECGQREVA